MKINKKDKTDLERIVNTLTKRGMNESPENLSLHSSVPRQRVRELLMKYPGYIRQETGAYYHYDAFTAAKQGRGIDRGGHPRFSGILREGKERQVKVVDERKELENLIREVLTESNLFNNIRKKRARGESPAKPGDKDYPDPKTWKKVTGQKNEDKLPGGKGDDLTKSDVDPRQLLKGIKVEMEHTNDRALAKEIALDHLAEDPEYYTKLQKIEPEHFNEAKYQGRDVTLNKPMKSDREGKAKKVYVKDGDKVKVVHFGDSSMENKSDDPERRKSFRARHNCDQKKDKTTPGYWACRDW